MRPQKTSCCVTMHPSASALSAGHQLPGPHQALQMYELRPESLTSIQSTQEGELLNRMTGTEVWSTFKLGLIIRTQP